MVHPASCDTELYGVELPAKYAHLTHHQQGIHEEGVQSDGQRRGESLRSRIVKHIGQYADDAGAQHAFHAEGDAQCHDAQRHEEQYVLPDE